MQDIFDLVKWRQEHAVDECPYIKHTSVYDSVRMKTYEGPNFCNLNDKPCLLEANDRCDTWEEIQNEDS